MGLLATYYFSSVLGYFLPMIIFMILSVKFAKWEASWILFATGAIITLISLIGMQKRASLGLFETQTGVYWFVYTILILVTVALRHRDDGTTEGQDSNSSPGQMEHDADESDSLKKRRGFLTGVCGSWAETDIPVECGSSIIVGTDSEQCNLVISGEQVSPVHMKIGFDGTVFQVTDCSLCGTFDMQQGALPKNLPVTKQPGTYLQLGNSENIFMLKCE